MDDILIHARHNTCTVVGQTTRGRKWMLKNYSSALTTIPVNVLDDFKKDLADLQLTYEDL